MATSYVVQAGDTWRSIAQAQLGNGTLALQLAETNGYNAQPGDLAPVGATIQLTVDQFLFLAPPNPFKGMTWFDTTAGVLKFWDGAAWRSMLAAAADFVKVAEVVVVAPQATLDFPAIPQTGRHLLLVVAARFSDAVGNNEMNIRLNGDAGLNYDTELLQAFGAAASGSEQILAGDHGMAGAVVGATAPAGQLSSSVIEIPHYAEAATRKAFLVRNAMKQADPTGNLFLRQYANIYRVAAAVARITLSDAGAGNFVAPTVASLYRLS